MRVLLVNDLPPEPGSGTEMYLRRLIDGLEAAGDTTEVFAGEVVHRGPAKVLDLWDPWARRAVAARAERFGADVVHHANVLRELSVSVLGVPSGVPCVLTVLDHRLLGVADQDWRGVRAAVDRHLKRPLDLRVARRKVDLAIGVSERLSADLRAAGFPRVAHVPVPAREPAGELEPVAASRDVVYAGRLAPDKGVQVLIAAFRALDVPDARLLIAGEGPERARLERLAAGDGRIRLLGRLDEAGLSGLLGASRIVAIPSLHALRPEGSPLVAAEAALHGRPIVASDDPGLREAVERLRGGLVVPAGDQRALHEALVRLLHSDDLATELGARGRRAAEQLHTVEAVTGRTRALYASLLVTPAGAGEPQP